ncbi:hypothetical protein [Glutamicibacter halophytocola]|uniref:Uncharacterized protein n=1 Tax=Glutamicibacter halophytocola TaxID=1933880 RepID=A0AA94XV65_9MICC|nr:hypothetical protein [Glutamicibacter halophytocola]UUX60555.1 hypothetical protein NUH22_08125 [Glutamicibacter halophytocola]
MSVIASIQSSPEGLPSAEVYGHLERVVFRESPVMHLEILQFVVAPAGNS